MSAQNFTGGERTQYDENTRDMGFESPLYSPQRDEGIGNKHIQFNDMTGDVVSLHSENEADQPYPSNAAVNQDDAMALTDSQNEEEQQSKTDDSQEQEDHDDEDDGSYSDQQLTMINIQTNNA